MVPRIAPACVSAVVYESRRDERGLSPRVPAALRGALTETVRIWSALDDLERMHRLEPTLEPDLGLVWAVHRWAGGARLETVLADGEIAAGDFVRWCKQVVDLLDQIAKASRTDGRPSPTGRAAQQAITQVRRGVVAYSSVS